MATAYFNFLRIRTMATAYFSVNNSDNSGTTIIAAYTDRVAELYSNDSAYTRLKKSNGKDLYVKQCRDTLNCLLPARSTVWTCVRSVSRSGMSRTATFHVVVNGEIQDVTYLFSIALGYKMKGDAIVLPGCGTDVCYDAVSNLSRIIHPDGAVVSTPDVDDQWFWKASCTLQHRTI